MKSHAIEWSNLESHRAETTISASSKLHNVLHIAAKSFMAIVPALAIVVGSAWLITMPDLVVYLQATLWASGFLFLGLALDSESPVNILHLATGIALPILAMMSSYVAVELAIVAAALVGAWVAVGIFRR